MLKVWQLTVLIALRQKIKFLRNVIFKTPYIQSNIQIIKRYNRIVQID